MKFSKISTVFIAIAIAGTIAGCSSGTNVTVPTPQVNYVAGQHYIYFAQNLDDSSRVVAGSGDTITSTVLTADTTFQGMSGVTVIQNSHSNAGTGIASLDTTYIAQNNGNYWHYNYGTQMLNTNSTALAANSGKLYNVGWVLQAELSATPGDKWRAFDTTLVTQLGTAPLVDTATEQSDTTITVSSFSSSSVFAKHAQHIIGLKAFITATMLTDTYVSSTYGTVKEVFHPTTLAGQATPGRVTILIGTK